MKHPPPRVALNGRRGAFQLLFSAVYLVIGASFFLLPETPSRAVALHWLTQFVPLWPFAALWLAAGLTGVVSAFLCRPKDRVGFFALTLVPAVWGFLFGIGALVGAPAIGLVSMAIYWLIAAAAMVVSGMQGPRDRDAREVVL
jgi:hypothetical protein